MYYMATLCHDTQAFTIRCIRNNFLLSLVNKDLIRTLAIIHELSVLVSGKQKGSLTQKRTQLAVNSLNQWLDEDLAA